MNLNEKPKVIVVDDSELNLIALEAALKGLNCEIVKFESGVGAIKYLETREAAVILLDVKMPDINGFEVARRLRKLQTSVKTPIIFVTGKEQTQADISEMKEVGGFDYMLKPLNVDLLSSKISFFIEMYIQSKELKEKTTRLEASIEDEKTSLLENALDAIVGIDENSIVTFWNENAENIFGWARNEILGKDLSLVIPERFRQAHRAGMKRFMNTGVAKIQNQRIEIPGLRRNGEEFIMELTVSAVNSPKGIRFFSFMRDISEQKLIQGRSEFLSRATNVLNSTLNLDKILNSLSDLTVPIIADWCSIQMINSNGKIEQVAVSHSDPNKVKWAWELQKRFPPDENVKQGPYEVIRTGKPELIRNITEEMLEETVKNPEQIEIIKSLGMKSFTCVPIVSRGQTVGTITLVISDESKRRYDEDDLNLALELGARVGVAVENAKLYRDSQAVNRLKDEFLANLSHELRTPMNVILGHSEILKNERHEMSDEELKASVEAIERNAKAQTAIISDLLDVSSIITGKVTYKPEDMNPSEVIGKILDGLRPTADAKRISLDFDNSQAPLKVSADPTRLHQIVWNLISNSIKFTEPGGRISVKVTELNSNWSILVTDTGIGIDEDFLPFVFERFRQEDATTTRKFGGLGLGLSVVRHLVELHGGYIKAESKGKGYGATFTVTLPLQALKLADNEAEQKRKIEAQLNPPPQNNLELSKVKVLLVEDSHDNRVLVSRILSRAGAQVVEAESAEEARFRLQQFKPDVIVSDIGMPEENGIEFMQKLRNSSSIPAIALTAFVRPEEREATLAAGFQVHLGKPVNAKSLILEISKLLSH